jgi:hypothetical protein
MPHVGSELVLRSTYSAVTGQVPALRISASGNPTFQARIEKRGAGFRLRLLIFQLILSIQNNLRSNRQMRSN